MEFQTLKKFNLWKWVAIVLVIGMVVLVVTLKDTKAKYRYTASYPIVTGTIHYEPRDISIIALNLEQDDGSYTESKTFPTSGYTINNEKSTCFINKESGKEEQDVTFDYKGNTLSITGLKSEILSVSCILIKKLHHLEQS